MSDFSPSPFPCPPRILPACVDIRAELDRRTPRQPDHEAENEAFIQLAEELSANPQNVLQKLTDIAVGLCRAGSAGVSLLENQDGKLVFRWAALAGTYVIHRQGTMAHHNSPCGVTIERDATQLMYLPEVVFPMRETPRIYEALLVPFHIERVPIGTVWVVTHDEKRKFDQEDERIVRSLSKFAAAGWMQYKARIRAEDWARTHWEELTAVHE